MRAARAPVSPARPRPPGDGTLRNSEARLWPRFPFTPTNSKGPLVAFISPLNAVRDQIASSRIERDALLAGMEEITRQAKHSGRPNLTPAEDADFDKGQKAVTLLDASLVELDAREAMLVDVVERRELAKGAPIHRPSGARHYTDDDRGIALRHLERETRVPDWVRSAAVDVIEGRDAQALAPAAAILADPDYTSAFLKLVRDPVRGHMEFTDRERVAFTKAAELQRAGMTSGTSATGGYLVPFVLDPNVILTGTGSINPVRKLATVKRVPAGNWHGATAAQVTAAWTAEGAVSPDNTPTIIQPSIPSWMGRAFIGASFEAFQDIADLANDVVTLFADAKDNLEAIAHMTSAGSASPKGVAYAVGAVAGSRVAPAVGGALALADAFTVQNALPPRHSKRASWTSSITPINKLRQLAMAQNSANSIWTDMANGDPPNFLGRGFEEASAMSGSITTGQDVLLYGDFAKYVVTDVIGGTALEFIPNLFDVATGRPTAQRGYHLWWRTGGDVVDADAFRILRL